MTTLLDETGHVEVVLPDCCWCGEPLTGLIKDGMHAKCAEEFAVEWDLGRQPQPIHRSKP